MFKATQESIRNDVDYTRWKSSDMFKVSSKIVGVLFEIIHRQWFIENLEKLYTLIYIRKFDYTGWRSSDMFF